MERGFELIQGEVLLSAWTVRIIAAYPRDARHHAVLGKGPFSPGEHVPLVVRCISRGGACCFAQPRSRTVWTSMMHSVADVLEEFGHGGKTADDDANGELGPGPISHWEQFPACVLRCDHSPRVVCAQDRSYTSAVFPGRISQTFGLIMGISSLGSTVCEMKLHSQETCRKNCRYHHLFLQRHLQTPEARYR